jgi:hypothetical protein
MAKKIFSVPRFIILGEPFKTKLIAFFLKQLTVSNPNNYILHSEFHSLIPPILTQCCGGLEVK